jgi:hypothetical protein
VAKPRRRSLGEHADSLLLVAAAGRATGDAIGDLSRPGDVSYLEAKGDAGAFDLLVGRKRAPGRSPDWYSVSARRSRCSRLVGFCSTTRRQSAPAAAHWCSGVWRLRRGELAEVLRRAASGAGVTA